MRLIVKDLPLASHPLARPAAEAARCAGAEGRFWEYHDRLFTEQPRFEREHLVRYATDLGLDAARFARCLDERRHAGAFDADVLQARALGVNATPTFLINGEKASNMPYEEFEAKLNSALGS